LTVSYFTIDVGSGEKRVPLLESVRSIAAWGLVLL